MKNNSYDTSDEMIYIRKKSIMQNFECQMKQQLTKVIDNNKINDIQCRNESLNFGLSYQHAINDILITLEKDESFIGLSEDEFINELKTVPSQEDFDDFCKECKYEKKLTYTNSTRREKLFTIMYTIGNYCVEPNVDIKRIVYMIVKFEIVRNDLISRIIKINKEHGKDNVLDCITSDMLLTGLCYFLSNTNLKIVSKNMTYYFTKLFYT